MYKIYINEVPFYLKKTEDILPNQPKLEGTLTARYTGKTKHLLQFIDMCEKTNTLKSVVIYHNDFEQLKLDFKSLFTINEAAGGVIRNELGELLVIFRRGFWDLPKGKLERGETKKEAAVREVLEETGLKSATIIDKVGITNHSFRNKSGIRILKKSHWYAMITTKQKLKPQVEEDIERVEWVDQVDFLANYKPIYSNIIDVLKSQGGE